MRKNKKPAGARLRGRANKKKILIICVSAFAVLLTVSACAVYIISRRLSEEEEVRFPTDHFLFESPDYDADIFSDPDYADIDKTVMFENGAETYPLTSDGFSRESSLVFIDYFDALRKGDLQALRALYSDEFASGQGAIPDFTMQRVYDAVVSFVGTERNEDGTDTDIYVVNYKIMKNDGTFRRDIDSDSSRPQVFYLKVFGSEWRICDIRFYKSE